MLNRRPAVYIMTNKRNGTLYTGVTSDLIKRVYQHKQGVTDSIKKMDYVNPELETCDESLYD